MSHLDDSRVNRALGFGGVTGLNAAGRKRMFLFAAIFLVAISVCVVAYLHPFWFPEKGSSIEVAGNVITVRKGGDLQRALDLAKPGDTIMLEAGATFSGAFQLPNKAGSDFITIRSSAPDAQLPPPGARIDPAKHAALLPKLQSNVKGAPTIFAVNGAHNYRFVAVEMGPTIDGLFNIVQLGTGEEKQISALPHDIEFDRVYIHGDPAVGQRRGIAANGRNIVIENSYISDIKRKGEESQGIAVWATDGPVKILNNYIEAGAENILFGGAGSTLRLVPSDCLVRDNFLNKPLEWRNSDWVVKNLFEIKDGKHIKIENNLMTNNWAMGQDGTAVLFTTRADNGPDTVIEDIEFTGNVVRGAGGGLNILGSEGGGGRRLSIRNNIFEDINGQKWKSAGHFMKVTDWDGLTIENNTILQTGNIASAYGKPIRNFIFRNNVIFENEYGVKGDNMGSGQEVIDHYFSGGMFANNVIIGGSSSRYREKNYYPATVAQVGFVNAAKGDFRLSPQGPFSGKANGGTAIGAELDPAKVGRADHETVN